MSFCFVLAVFVPEVANAQESPSEPRLSRYVTITFEIHGLEESAKILKDAVSSLATTLENVQSGAKDFSPEQLDRLVAVARETNEVVRAVERTIQESGPAIERARGPTKAMVADVLSTAKHAAVYPVLRSIHFYVTTWLVVAILGGLAALLLTFWVFFSIGKQLRDMVASLKAITGEYEIVRRASPNNALQAAPEDGRA